MHSFQSAAALSPLGWHWMADDPLMNQAAASLEKAIKGPLPVCEAGPAQLPYWRLLMAKHYLALIKYAKGDRKASRALFQQVRDSFADGAVASPAGAFREYGIQAESTYYLLLLDDVIRSHSGAGHKAGMIAFLQAGYWENYQLADVYRRFTNSVEGSGRPEEEYALRTELMDLLPRTQEALMAFRKREWLVKQNPGVAERAAGLHSELYQALEAKGLIRADAGGHPVLIPAHPRTKLCDLAH